MARATDTIIEILNNFMAGAEEEITRATSPAGVLDLNILASNMSDYLPQESRMMVGCVMTKLTPEQVPGFLEELSTFTRDYYPADDDDDEAEG